MNYGEAMEAKGLLEELMEVNFAKTKATRLMEILGGIFENEVLKKERADLGLKSSYAKRDPEAVLSRMMDGFINIPAMHQEAYDDVGKLNIATNDVLHAIELLEMTPEQEHETIQTIKKIRDQRRMAKEFMEITEPIVAFSKQHATLVRDLKNIMAEVRKIKERQVNRKYEPKQVPSLKEVSAPNWGLKEKEPTAMELAFAQASAAKEVK